jgi:hypothetical protein
MNGPIDDSGPDAEVPATQVADKPRVFPLRSYQTNMAFERRSCLHHEWRPGAAYFVNWRLYGSLPVSRVATLWTLGGERASCTRLGPGTKDSPLHRKQPVSEWVVHL